MTLGCALAITCLFACKGTADGGGQEQALMQEGVDALYTRRDPIAAAVVFRKVLERNPTHYGATFQLASALDQSGSEAEGRLQWARVLQMADGHGDTKTAETAWARLVKPDATSDEAMQAGLDA